MDVGYLAHCLLWSGFWFAAGVAVTETGWYVRWRLTRERRKQRDYT